MKKERKKKLQFDVPIPDIIGNKAVKVVTIDIETTSDPELPGVDLITPEAHRRIDDTKAIYTGLLLPEEIRELRVKKLGLSSKELAELLQVGVDLYARWESRRAWPSRSVSILLHALRDGTLTVAYLRSLDKVREERIKTMSQARAVAEVES